LKISKMYFHTMIQFKSDESYFAKTIEFLKFILSIIMILNGKYLIVFATCAIFS